MKIGIYNSCKQSATGSTVLVLGNLLARRHETEVIRFQDEVSKTPIGESVSVRIVDRPPQTVTDPNSPDRRYQAIRDWSNELTRPYDLFINIADALPIYCAAPRGVLLIQFPHDFVPVHYRSFWQAHLDSYQLKLVNSYYIGFWTNIFWELNCEVLYPPIPILTPDQKEQLIVCPVRFDARNSNNQLKLISIFKELKAQSPEWNLTMLGEVDERSASKRSFAALNEAANDANTSILANPTSEQAQSVFRRAKILWQANGLNEDFEHEPRRFEGFCVAEAMSTGCIPLVTNSAGLPELIKHEQNGLFWRHPGELLEYTLMLSQKEGNRSRLARAARRRAYDFRPERFATTFLAQLDSAFGLRSYSRANPVWLWRRLMRPTANPLLY